jgi:arylsulfatase A-like enzyme
MVYSMDENVGRLIEKLKEEGIYDETTIIFTSDNGGLSTLDSSWNRVGPTSVRPLRGGKGWLYEGGIRVPLLIKPMGEAFEPKEIDHPVVGHDLFPTVLAAAGVREWEPVDGVNLKDIEKDQRVLGERTLYWHFPHYHGSGWTPGIAIRQGKWKLVYFYESEKTELYDLMSDQGERIDLAKTYPEKADELQRLLLQWQSEVGAEVPIPNNGFQFSRTSEL